RKEQIEIIAAKEPEVLALLERWCFRPEMGWRKRKRMKDRSSMIDPFGRAITYLRVSVTDRCDFRCVYCMAEDMHFLPKRDLLSLEELDRLCTVFIEKGVRRLRLPGGEPLVRKNIGHRVRRLSRHLQRRPLDERTLTATGTLLVRS